MRRTDDDPRFMSSASMPAVDEGQTQLKILAKLGLNNFQLLQCMLALVMLFQMADGAMLPGIFKTLEERMHGATPVSLGNIVLLEALCHSVSVLFWGFFVDRGCKLQMLMYSMFAWGIITFASALVDSVVTLAVVRALAGIVGAGLGPISQGLIGLTCSPQARARAFGNIIGMGQAGHMLGLMLAGTTSHFEAIGGWRGSFLFFSVCTLCLAWIIRLVRVEVQDGFFAESRTWARLVLRSRGCEDWTFKQLLCEILGNVGIIFKRNSFLVLLLQGAFASTTLKAMQYQMMWYQYLGFDDFRASAIASAAYAGCMVGAFSGGCLSDAIARRYPRHGRICFGQICVGLELVVLVFIFMSGEAPSPRGYAAFTQRVGMSFLFGITSIMAYALVVKPLFIEIVPSHMIAQVVALAAAIDGAFSSFLSTPLVGWITEHVFDYQTTTLEIRNMPDTLRRHNANALGKAIGVLTVVSTALTIVSFSLLHCTYPKDHSSAAEEEEEEDSANESITSKGTHISGYSGTEKEPGTPRKPMTKRVSFSTRKDSEYSQYSEP
eukprot:TRINITY_DN10602_c0_g2_i1.p1 TRINITY_DN10602_c0_g2~~TRINITY_DN10602_c0_g2_i1.p1  ORF type:complete len:550 (-),score=67.60 TRINITY_DN10602_c0_g2_i1:88-1737(-)